MEFVGLERFLFSFVFVLGLIGILGLLARKYGAKSLNIKPKGEARLQVTETLALDPRFRLFIVRRDEVEHLIVKGPEGVQVIESGFPRKKEPLLPEEPQFISGKTDDDA
ncbi:MAG: hypothetical protein FJX23_02880 [Alphaproteobacteria bacterium]|nr:hypothetical protein [Alphaproteobacteria bacterium]